MGAKEPGYFDPETVIVMQEVLDEAWSCLSPERRATTAKTALAERILRTAAKGERSRKRLLDVALRDLAA
jgi:hypothetical protein